MPGKPFSGKQKKEQLKAKRQEKREKEQNQRGHGQDNSSGDDMKHGSREEEESDEDEKHPQVDRRAKPTTTTTEASAPQKGKYQQQQQRPGTGPKRPVGQENDDNDATASQGSSAMLKYGGDKKGVRSVFAKEADRTVAERKKLSYEPIVSRDFRPGVAFGSWFELLSGAAIQGGTTKFSNSFPFSVSLPTRVASLINVPEDVRSEAEAVGRVAENPVEAEESVIFSHWLKRLDGMAAALPSSLAQMEINVFERNLDVWRQLWRTVEIADVVIIVADARYPIMHLPLSLLHYVKIVNKKQFIVLLNKVDLVPESLVAAWKSFLSAYFVATGIATSAEEVPILSFSCLPEAETVTANEHQRTDKRRSKKKRNVKLYEELHSGHLRRGGGGGGDDDEDEEDDSEASDKYDDEANFKGKSKAEAELSHGKRSHKELAMVSQMIEAILQTCKKIATGASAGGRPHKRQGDGSLFIGIVGHPNVGKSSLINCIRGTKVVSVSSTAGHTKHLQTIPIPSDGVTLFDCPGLAFPVFGVPRQLQAVIGTHQIAQTRDPQSSVGYLATRLPLEKIYGLKKIDGIESDPWSSFELCESYATKKGFMVKHGRGIADVHRAAIDILKEAYEGRLVLYFSPPPSADGYLASKEFADHVKPFLLLHAFTAQQQQ